MKVTAIIAVGIVLTASLASAAVYKADLGASAQPVASGWTGPSTTVNFNANATPTFNLGDGVTLTFSTVNNYGFANASNPVIQDGFFTTGTATFTLSGLNAGDKVTLYAIHAWDGNGRAAFVSFAGSPLVQSKTAIDANFNTKVDGAYPYANPSASDMALVTTDALVGVGGTLSGYFTTTNGTSTVQEAQLGGLQFSVTAVPEPASLAALGLAGVFGVRRRR